MLQSRLEIIRRENRRWDIEEIVRISQTCVILHDMLITMVDSDEIITGDGCDIITEFYESQLDDQVEDVAGEGPHEHVETQGGVDDVRVVPGTGKVAEFLLAEFTITTRAGFEALRGEFVTSLLST